MHILMIFLDGVGLGEDNPDINPFAAGHFPVLQSLACGQHWLNNTGTQQTQRAAFVPTDPRMGVDGRPQSASGQAAILTGRNIPRIIGEHYGPKPNQAIRDLLAEDNFFKQVITYGKSAALLEAYPPTWHHGINSGKNLPSSYQFAAQSAGLRFMDIDDLRAGSAISGDWTGEAWQSRMGFDGIPVLTPYEAGMRLVNISRRYDFAFFSHWITDVVGHRGTLEDAIRLLVTFDSVMAGILDTWHDDEGLVIIASDHGNIEAIGSRKHTENDVPTVIIGSEKQVVAQGLSTLADLVPGMAKVLF